MLLETVVQSEGVGLVGKLDITVNTETREERIDCKINTIYDAAENLSICVGSSFNLSSLLDTTNEPIKDTTDEAIRDTL